MMKNMTIGVLIGMLIGLAATAYAGTDLYTWKKRMFVYEDPETKVQYLITETGFCDGVAMCPRYDSNGNIIGTKSKEAKP